MRKGERRQKRRNTVKQRKQEKINEGRHGREEKLEKKKKKLGETGFKESLHVSRIHSGLRFSRRLRFRGLEHFGEIIRGEVTKRSYENVARTLNTRKHVVETGNSIDTWKVSQV